MDIFKNLKDSFYRVKYFAPDYFLSIAFFQIIKVILVVPIISFLFSKILSSSHLTNLTNNDILVILKHPISIILFFILLIVSILFIFYELGYYFVMADNQIRNIDYNFKSIIKTLNKKARYFMSFYSIYLILYLLILSPLVLSGLNTNFTSSIKIPNFIIDELLMTQKGVMIYSTILIILTYIGLRLIYTMYFFIKEENLNIYQAIKESIKFSKGKTIKNFLLIVLTTFIYSLITTTLIFIALIPVMLSDFLIPKISPITAGFSLTLIGFIAFFISGLIDPIIANIIIGSTGFFKDEKHYTKQPAKILGFIKSKKIISISFTLIIIVIFALNIYTVITIVYQPNTLIIGHRGFMEKAVENSIEGVIAAKKAGAEYVELDIQETIDNKFIVIHDYNLKRLSGINKSVKDLTLEELQNITIKQNGHTAKIPSLDDFIDTAKEVDIKLLIEVKPHGNESQDMEKNLISLLKEKNVEYKFLVQSLDLEVLNKIKTIDKDIKTGYIIPLLIGKVPDTLHDFIVLEDFSVNTSIIKQVDQMDKHLFVWTINEDTLMKKYFKFEVSGMITNHPDTALKIREQDDDTKTFLNRIQFLLED